MTKQGLVLLLVVGIAALILLWHQKATSQIRIEPANMTPVECNNMVSAVYKSGAWSNGLSVYYVEKYTQGPRSWYHVLFNDANERQSGVHPVFDIERDSTGWSLVKRRN